MCDRYVFESLSKYMCEHIATSKGGRYVTFKCSHHLLTIDIIENIEDDYSLRFVHLLPKPSSLIFEVLEDIT